MCQYFPIYIFFQLFHVSDTSTVAHQNLSLSLVQQLQEKVHHFQVTMALLWRMKSYARTQMPVSLLHHKQRKHTLHIDAYNITYLTHSLSPLTRRHILSHPGRVPKP